MRRAASVVGVSVAGTMLIVAGLVMLVTPGPGLLAIGAGMALLGREYRWARRLLDRARARLRARTSTPVERSPHAPRTVGEDQRTAA